MKLNKRKWSGLVCDFQLELNYWRRVSSLAARVEFSSLQAYFAYREKQQMQAVRPVYFDLIWKNNPFLLWKLNKHIYM